MSSNIAIRVEHLNKCYQIYDQPRDRLKQSILPRLQRLGGRQPQQYFHDFWALRNISFEVKKGESVGIIGRNGSGKSTLLQIITGTLAPSSGIVQTSGRIAALLELGSGFNPDFSGRENVFLNGALLGLTRAQIEAKFDAIAAFADIGEHLDQPVKTYSSGMLVRLAFAVQVQVEPDILIVDEALAVGDWLFQKRCFQRIEKLVSDGTTLLFVSHDQESVRTLTNRALLLNRGVAQAWGVSSEVVLEYRKLLHDEEASYFNMVAKSLTERRQQTESIQEAATAHHVAAPKGQESTEEAGKPVNVRSEQLSFGDGNIDVLQVKTLDAAGNPCSVFHPGDLLRIKIACRARVEIDHLNVGVRLRNKEGVKIYSWGTLNQDMRLLSQDPSVPVFWNRKFREGEEFEVELSCPCLLGTNLYEIQASVTYEGNPDYTAQRVLRWVDEAAFFQVLMRKDEHFFGGVIDLQMKAIW